MAARPADLPEYDNPPVVEVVLSVQFAELRNYRTVHGGLLWDKKFRTSFGEFSEHPPLDPTFETFGPPGAVDVGFSVKQMLGPPVPRLWFAMKNKTELIQFQADRFIHNWRKVKSEDTYPKYENIKEKFLCEIKDVEQFIQAEHIGHIDPNQCEVTYVNHIYFEKDGDPRDKLEEILRPWAKVDADPGDEGATLPPLEDARFAARYVIKGGQNSPFGRLLIQAEPVVAQNNQPIVRLNLTARGAPHAPSMDGVEEFFDIGREAIVRGFTAITTPAMHRIWGRRK